MTIIQLPTSTRRLLMSAALLLIGLSGAVAAPTTLDVSQPFSYVDSTGKQVSLSAVSPESDPQVITNKFIGLIRAFEDQGINGTIFIPRGTWRLTRTLYLSQMNMNLNRALVVNLQGAGQTATILQAAPGFEEIPLVMLGEYIQNLRNDLNRYHRPRIEGIYDGSVTGVKYGLRTQSTPEGITTVDRGAWKAGADYAPGDKVSMDNPARSYVCSTGHTSTDAPTSPDKPDTGTNWRAFWRQVGIPATGYILNSPLTAGPLDPTKNDALATYWHNTDQLTLDLLVKNNGPEMMDGVLAAISNSEYGSSVSGSVWILSIRPDNGIYFTIVLPTGVPNESDKDDSISAHVGPTLGQGIHRISVQVNLRDPNRQLAAWIDGKQQSITVDGKPAATYQYPAGTRFLPYQAGGFIFGTGGRGQVAMQTQDWTYAGLKVSNSLRYSVGAVGDTQRTIGGAPATDASRYFSNDAQTVGYLPLDDAPPADTDFLNPLWKLFRVQNGGAATPPGQTPQSGYGFWLAPLGGYQPGAAIEDLTLRNPDRRYGAPFSIYLCYGVDMERVNLDGGFSGFDRWPCGANLYVNRLRNVNITNASNAGIFNVGQSMYMAENLTVSNCGREELYIPLCGGDWSNVTLRPSRYTENVVWEPAEQSEGQQFYGVTVLPEATHHAPSHSVFTIGRQLYGMTGPNNFILRGVRAMDLPPGIIFLDMPDYAHGWGWPEGTMTVEDYDFSVVNGGKLSAFLREDNPEWHGVITAATQALNRYVSAWHDNTSGVMPWHVHSYGTSYNIDDIVSDHGVIYRCIRSHNDAVFGHGDVVKHEPGVGKDWNDYWQEYPSTNILFVHPDFTALPTSGYWVEGGHILRIPKANGTYTEYRCVRSGDAASKDAADRPLWDVVEGAG